jgi:hypothetical protein
MQMNAQRLFGWAHIAAVALSLGWINAASGQAFSSGSTGADGTLVVSGAQTITVRPGGVYNYTTVTINTNSSLNFVPGPDNSPVILLATGDVTINAGGVIAVNGSNGLGSVFPTVGGPGGPGGFAGGNGGVTPNLASAGHGPGGGQPVAATPGAGQRGTYGAPDAFVSLIPLIGGSGGAGGGSTTGTGSGGGGGGAILIASSTRINLPSTNSHIRANGGNSASAGSSCNSATSSAGSGGAIRLVAPQIAGPGLLRAIGGTPCSGGTAGGDGRIRLEASTMEFTGSAIPVPSTSLSPGPVSPVGNPVLANVPTLAIASIAGQALPPTTGASYFTPDVTLPLETTNPVPVALTATNTPVGAPTAMAVRLIPQTGSWTDVPVTTHTGTFASSTASADVTFPVGRVSVVQAIASFTLTGQTASLFPSIDGEPVERVLVAASPGEASTLSLVTKSGREVRVDRLRAEEQQQVARAWQILKETHVE